MQGYGGLWGSCAVWWGSPVCGVFEESLCWWGCGGGLVGIGHVFGVSLQGGLSSWVWGLLRPSSLGGVPQPKFVEDSAWGVEGFGTLDLFLVPLSCGCGFSCGGLHAGMVSAGLLLCLLVGVMASWAFCWWGSSIVLYGVFLGPTWFHKEGVCWVCLLCWYFDFPFLFSDFFMQSSIVSTIF